MGCPCANPPGSSSVKKPVVRNPYTLKPDKRVSRNDIRKLNFILDSPDDGKQEDETVDDASIRPKPRTANSRRPQKSMSGFLNYEPQRR